MNTLAQNELEETSAENSNPSIVKTITSPLRQFSLIKKSPKILKPLIGIIILQLFVFSFLGFLSVDPEILSSVKSSLEISEKRIKMVVAIFTTLGGVLNSLFSLLIMSIAIKIGMIFVQSDINFKQIFSLLVHVSIIPMIGIFINIIMNLLIETDAFTTFTNLGIFFPEDTSLYKVFSSIDIFFIAQIILIGMGLFIIGGISKLKATILCSLIISFNLAFAIINVSI
ncbi:YIP1 family protein [Bacillus massilinigeriensis]|uniref:YIP1 family protein n=1 Tax=Bacillus mediterraneensis TaxID=1805474 RepID=UPI0008F932A9|nr:YIP1 family protein [Bacillus mediterraneensis]